MLTARYRESDQMDMEIERLDVIEPDECCAGRLADDLLGNSFVLWICPECGTDWKATEIMVSGHSVRYWTPQPMIAVLT